MHKFSMEYRIKSKEKNSTSSDILFVLKMQVLSFFTSLKTKNNKSEWFFLLIDDFFKDRLKIKSKTITIFFLVFFCLILSSFFMHFVNELRSYSGYEHIVFPEGLKGYSITYFLFIVPQTIIGEFGKIFLIKIFKDNTVNIIYVIPFLVPTLLNIEFFIRKFFLGRNKENSQKEYTGWEKILMKYGFIITLFNISYLFGSIFFLDKNLANKEYYEISVLLVTSNILNLLLYIFYFFVFIMALLTKELFVSIFVFSILSLLTKYTDNSLLFFLKDMIKMSNEITKTLFIYFIISLFCNIMLYKTKRLFVSAWLYMLTVYLASIYIGSIDNSNIYLNVNFVCLYYLICCYLICTFITIFKINEKIDNLFINIKRVDKYNIIIRNNNIYMTLRIVIMLCINPIYPFYPLLAPFFLAILCADAINKTFTRFEKEMYSISNLNNYYFIRMIKQKTKALFFLISVIIIVSTLYQSVDKMFLKSMEFVVSKSFILDASLNNNFLYENYSKSNNSNFYNKYKKY